MYFKHGRPLAYSAWRSDFNIECILVENNVLNEIYLSSLHFQSNPIQGLLYRHNFVVLFPNDPEKLTERHLSYFTLFCSILYLLISINILIILINIHPWWASCVFVHGRSGPGIFIRMDNNLGDIVSLFHCPIAHCTSG